MSMGSTPKHAQTAGDLGFAVQFNAKTLWHFAQLRYPRDTPAHALMRVLHRRNQGTPLEIRPKIVARFEEAAAALG